jgi:hypothetical protein
MSIQISGSSTPLFSEFTIALLKDTGWYTSVSAAMAEPIFFGKGKGCDFVQQACSRTPLDSEFTAAAGVSGCDFIFQGRAIGASDDFMDSNCNYMKMNEDCTNALNSANAVVASTYEVFGKSSKCFKSSFA